MKKELAGLLWNLLCDVVVLWYGLHLFWLAWHEPVGFQKEAYYALCIIVLSVSRRMTRRAA